MAVVQRVRLVWRYAGLRVLILFLFLVTLRAALAVSHDVPPSSSGFSSSTLLWFVVGLGVFNVVVVFVVLIFALQRRKKKRELEAIIPVVPEQPAESLPKRRSVR